MARLLLLLAIIVVLALVVRKVMKGISTKRAETEAEVAPPPEARLVRCVECGAFVPRAEALPAPNGFRCGGAGCNTNR